MKLGGARPSVAIIGTGVSGLVVAHHLHHDHDITVFEADERVGGHANTVDIEIDGRSIPVDTGFIVCNERTYPHFLGLLDELGVATQPSDMSFGVSDEATGLEYRASNPASLLAQPRNAADPRFHRMLVDIVRCNRTLRHLDDRSAAGDGDGLARDLTLRDFVDIHGYSRRFVDHFLVPFGAAIWSADPTTFLDFPVATYARFMNNHGLLDLFGRPAWRTVTGGSRRYVEALIAPFVDRIHTGTPVEKVVRRRGASGIGADSDATVELVVDGATHTFDHVVLATHSDQALRLLADPSTAERSVLGAIGYQPNVAVLHTDHRLLPRAPRARASWNFHTGTGEQRLPTLTYWMNRLQSLPTEVPVMVTLNRTDAIDPARILRVEEYAHPVFDSAAMAAQSRRHQIQGRDGTWFAGAYWRYGFHEDGVMSGLDVVDGIRGTAGPSRTERP